MSSTVGILGLGYLGKRLTAQSLPTGSWATLHPSRKPPDLPSVGIPLHEFRWEQKETWHALPDLESVLILTIPPLCESISDETVRLEFWCKWIRANRAGFRKLIYISTTGVYPNRPGDWDERSQVEPDNQKGKIRKRTERILSDYFDLRVIRSGAIYGKDRNIGIRLMAGKPIPKGDHPVHRIHVEDLAQITGLAARKADFPAILNAVDNEPESSENVARWLLQQPFFPMRKHSRTFKKSRYFSRKKLPVEPERIISNRLLVNECRYRLTYPTYREGLRQAFQS